MMTFEQFCAYKINHLIYVSPKGKEVSLKDLQFEYNKYVLEKLGYIK